MKRSFDFNLIFGWKGNFSFSPRLWYIETDHEKRLVYCYIGRAMPTTEDVVAFNFVFLWVHVCVGYLKVRK
jgi:hypothetical protein